MLLIELIVIILILTAHVVTHRHPTAWAATYLRLETISGASPRTHLQRMALRSLHPIRTAEVSLSLEWPAALGNGAESDPGSGGVYTQPVFVMDLRPPRTA